MNSLEILDVGQANELKHALRRNGWTNEMVKKLSEGDALLRVKNFLFESSENQEVFHARIDYSRTIEEMVESGKYDYANSNINSKNFSISGEGVIDFGLELLHFNRDISTKDAFAEIDLLGYRPATIEEILAFGAAYPEKQREFPIIALGSSWFGPGGGRRVPCLNRPGSERELNLLWRDGGDWFAYCRFLVARK